MIRFLESLLRPPNSLIWLSVVGLLLLRTRHRRLGVAVLGVSVLSLYLLSTPLMVWALLKPLDRYPPLEPSASSTWPDAQAIAVLSAGKTSSLEYGGEVITAMAFERLRYAAWLHEHVDRPILITGRTGALMADSMSRWFGVEARWVEGESRNTHEHAVNCTPLFERAGIERIYVVTHFWHMSRAVAAFGQVEGLEVVPAPLGFGGKSRDWYDPRWLMPSGGSLYASGWVLHEWIGRLWYRVRYGY